MDFGHHETNTEEEVSYWSLIYIRARELLLLCLVTESLAETAEEMGSHQKISFKASQAGIRRGLAFNLQRQIQA